MRKFEDESSFKWSQVPALLTILLDHSPIYNTLSGPGGADTERVLFYCCGFISEKFAYQDGNLQITIKMYKWCQ